ncbi:hypothetical protein H0H93_002692 [Arthromyces matolae]|nr:hypothetical protein H0H93_002692 [Arthromyces matolae]
MPRVEIRDGGVYKLRSALSGEVIAFSRTDAEGVKVRTHLDTNADGQMWEATFTGGQTFKGEKFFKLKTLDKRGGTDYYLGYSSSEAGQPVVARTTGEEWIFQPESGSGEMYL